MTITLSSIACSSSGIIFITRPIMHCLLSTPCRFTTPTLTLASSPTQKAEKGSTGLRRRCIPQHLFALCRVLLESRSRLPMIIYMLTFVGQVFGEQGIRQIIPSISLARTWKPELSFSKDAVCASIEDELPKLSQKANSAPTAFVDENTRCGCVAGITVPQQSQS